MKVTTLADIYNCLKGEGGEEIIMDEDLRSSAVKCINKMIEYGG
jgi:quinolinate synthase